MSSASNYSDDDDSGGEELSLRDLELETKFKHEYVTIQPPESVKETKRKKRPKVLMGNYIYRHLRTNQVGVDFWRCREAKCGSIIRTYEGLASDPSKHNCDSKFSIEIDAILTKAKILERTQREGENSAAKIYSEELSLFGARHADASKQMIAKFFPTFESIKSSIYARRVEMGASAIHTAEDIVIQGEYALTSDNKRFLLFDETHSVGRIIAFASDCGLEILAKADQWHADGTFTYVQSGGDSASEKEK